MDLFLEEGPGKNKLFPFTETRHTADILIGLLTIREKWKLLTGFNIRTGETGEARSQEIIIDASLVPTVVNYKAILAAAGSGTSIEENEDIRRIVYPWHITQNNDWAIRQDFPLVTKGRKSQPLAATNRCEHPENLFIEPDAIVEYSIINASGGPVYIGKETHIMEGNLVRAPFAILEGSVLKMGSKIYSGTTIGPWCVVGGEVKNSVLFGYSNKAHDGYLGDSVLGEWCNLGAGTSCSNVKNTAGDIRIPVAGEPINAGQKTGLHMGDYSRSAINTSFNTGSIVGTCCNIFGSTAPQKYIPSFTWGQEIYIFEKVLKDITNWKKLKNKSLTTTETTILHKLYTTNK